MMLVTRVLLFAVSLLAPHFRSSLRLHSLGGDRRLDAARRRLPLHRITRPGAYAGRLRMPAFALEERKLPMKFRAGSLASRIAGAGSARSAS